MIDKYRSFESCCLHSQVSILSSTKKSGRFILNNTCTVAQRTERILALYRAVFVVSHEQSPFSIPNLTGKAPSEKAKSQRVNITKRLSTVLNGDNVFTLFESEHETYDSVLYSK